MIVGLLYGRHPSPLLSMYSGKATFQIHASGEDSLFVGLTGPFGVNTIGPRWVKHLYRPTEEK